VVSVLEWTGHPIELHKAYANVRDHGRPETGHVENVQDLDKSAAKFFEL
jgi:hypothetical protein